MSSSSINILSRTYDHTIHYKPGKFIYGKLGEVYSSNASLPETRQENQRIMNVGIKQLKEFKKEKVLMKIIPGKDGRKKVKNTSEYPYTIHAKLKIQFGDDFYGGSGSLVGPHHVLTCGHNVYDTESAQWAKNIVVYPALNKASAPFGLAKVTQAYTFSQYAKNDDKAYDMALLILDWSIGKRTGWGGLCSAPDSKLRDLTFNITGYPGDKGFYKMYEMGHKVKTIEKEMFHYEIDTFGGQSGSAIWVKDDLGGAKIMGVHTLGYHDKNSGVRISREKFIKFLQDTITNTYKIQKNQPINLPSTVSNPSSNSNLTITPTTRSPNATISSSSSSSSSSSTQVSGVIDAQKKFPHVVFGKSIWQRYFNVEEAETPLPANIEEILKAPTTFKVEGYTERDPVHKTHLLVWVPRKVNGENLTLNNLQNLFGKYNFYSDHVKNDLGNKEVASHWILVSKGVLEGTRTTNAAGQLKIVDTCASKGYTLPTALDAAVVTLLYQKEKPGQYLLGKGKDLDTYTRCLERVNISNQLLPMAIGGLSKDGLRIHSYKDIFDIKGAMVACNLTYSIN